MNQEMMSEIFKRLDLLAAKLGTSAQFLWAVMRRQATVELWTTATSVALSLAGTVGSVYLLKLGVRIFYSNNSGYDAEGRGIIISIVGGILLATNIIWFIISVASLPTLALNPDYWVLRDILSTVK